VRCLCGHSRCSRFFFKRPPIPLARPCLGQIDAAHQQHKLLPGSAAPCRRTRQPAASADGLPPCAWRILITRAIKEQSLHAVASRVGKKVKLVAQLIALEPVTHRTKEIVEAQPHVGCTRCHIDAVAAPNSCIAINRSKVTLEPMHHFIRRPSANSTHNALRFSVAAPPGCCVAHKLYRKDPARRPLLSLYSAPHLRCCPTSPQIAHALHRMPAASDRSVSNSITQPLTPTLLRRRRKAIPIVSLMPQVHHRPPEWKVWLLLRVQMIGYRTAA